jgi:hypothetical protein
MGMTESEMKTIAGMVAREIGVLMEDVQHKFDLVVEGHQLLTDKIERVGERVEKVVVRVEKIDLDLTAHRNDTEAHRGIYRVGEPG